ncbi:MAG: hypothetical protein IT461_16580 [Planctomycetes bacterium]|nr:hypothetical protein [Planctomycetota bacterium]
MSVHVLRCPNCGADLEVADGSATIRCRYCRAHCRVQGVGTAKKLTAEEEAAWNGLIEEAKKIDLDALESDLESLKQFYEEKKSRDLWEALADNALNNEAELDALAQRWVSEGTGRKFLANMSTIASGDSVQHKAIKRVVDRLAAKVALLLTEEAENAAARDAALAAQLGAIRDEAERRAAQVEKRLVELNSPAELEKVRAAKALIARVEAEQQAAAISKSRSTADYIAEQSEEDRKAALALRRQYRMSRVWAVVSFPVVMLCMGAAGFALLNWRPEEWVRSLGGVLFFGSPFMALFSSSLTWSKGSEAGRKYNEVASQLDLPPVAMQPQSPGKAARGCTSETAGGCGCVGFVVIAVGIWAIGHFGVGKSNTPSPANTAPPASDNKAAPPSNVTAPSNAPAGNTTPPAKGESASANNAPRSD